MLKYDEKSIHTMTPLEAIRTRLGMYISGDDNEAVHHVVKEIISNSIDEYLAGYGEKISVTVNEKENWVEIKDEGRGIPHGKLNDVFTKTHTSGKIKSKDKSAYGASGGLNGIGAKVATATGRVDVKSVINGKSVENFFHYEKVGTEKISKTKDKNGTIVRWKPDDGVFTDNQLYQEKIEELLQNLSYLTPKLTFIINNGKEKIIESKGIEDYLKDNITSKNMLSDIMTFSAGDDFLHVHGAMVWNNGQGKETSYVNLIPTVDGGTHVTALKTVMTREINKMFNSDLKGNEIRQGWNLILSIKTTEEPVFKGQQKSALNMPILNGQLNSLYKEEIEKILLENKNFFEKMKEIIEKTRQKEKAVSQVREVLSKTKTKNNPLPQKLKPALNKTGAELFITEGDSASGSLIQHRNIYKHAIMSLKGKPINVLKHDIEKVLKNQEIKDLIIALGGFGENYDSKKCPYEKIILMADADEDGKHIELLLLSFLYKFYPQLMREGRIYIIQTPLYSIKTSKGMDYAFSEKEMKTKNPGAKAIISRFKGLGEVEPDVLAEFTFSENKRRLVQLDMSDEETVADLLENFMGEDVEYRREFVE